MSCLQALSFPLCLFLESKKKYEVVTFKTLRDPFILKQVRLFLNENKARNFFFTQMVKKNLPHPKYQNNYINNNQMKMSKFDLTEF